MHVSEARLNANRLNAARSTGPKTEEGKNASRRNGLTHGLSGDGPVVAERDAEEIARRVEVLRGDLRPKSPLGEMMIPRMATLSLRAEKAGDRETVAVAKNVRHAVDNHDEGRFDEADRLFETLAENPRKNLRLLKKMPEGVDLLVEAWQDLRVDLEGSHPSADWAAKHLDRMANLLGKKAETGGNTGLGALARAVGGDFAGLGAKEGEGLTEGPRRQWAKARLVERIDAEVEALEAHRATIDREMIELDRLDAPGLALFDTSKEATLARRYEGEAHRGFFQALREFRRAEAEFAEKANEAATSTAPAPPAAPTRMQPSSKMGSLREPAPLSGFEPPNGLVSPFEPATSTVCGRDGQPLTIGRASKAGV